MNITAQQARNIALWHQLQRFKDCKGKAGALEVIRTLSYVQLDTISVIERAHHHTLYNRVQKYQSEMLNELLAKDKTIWEYWGHAASYLPRDDYPFYRQRMLSFPNNQWERNLWHAHTDISEYILERIRKEGPLSSKNFEDNRENKANNGWGNVKPAKIMLELLMWRGDLIVTARNIWQRVYDLTERVIPNYREIEIPTDEQRARFMVTRTLQAHGLATEWDINNHITLAPKTAVHQALNNLLKKKEILKTKIDNVKDDFYILAKTDIDNLSAAADTEAVKILSPFDNIAILRPRLQKIFDFDYTLECYVTPAKRKFGYWNCPVVYGDSIVGIVDPKADRKKKLLTLNSVFIRKGIWKRKPFQNAFEKELAAFARFNGCTEH